MTGPTLAALLAALVAMALWLVIRRAHFPGPPEVLEVAPQWIGRRLLQDYVLAFELISVLLVVAMIGAVMVARRDPGRRAPGTAAGTAPRRGAPR